MRKTARLHRSSCVALVIAGLTAACSENLPTSTARSFHPAATTSREAVPLSGRHIFVMKNGIPGDFAARVAEKGGTIITEQDEIQLVITAGLSDADAAALGAGGLVGNDFTARWVPTTDEMAEGTSSITAGTSAVAQAGSPFNAVLLGQQWNMWQIHAPEAWQTKTGSPSVKVAILDSGIDPDHQDLAGRVDLTNSARVVADASGRCFFGTAKSLWVDDFFHGTYVSSVVTTNNLIIAGVAPNVQLVAVKVLDNTGSGSFSDILCGMLYASLVVHAPVINMSLGATIRGNTPGLLAFQQAIANIVELVRSNGGVVVSAAGNEDLNLGLPHPFLSLPCEAGTQLCVSATSSRDAIARYSNFGRAAIDVAAPGGDDKHLGRNPTEATLFQQLVFGACSGYAPICAGSHSTYLWAAGTSASAPHVAGLAALLFSQPGPHTPDAVIARIRETADPIGNQSKYGDGRINVARALGVQ